VGSSYRDIGLMLLFITIIALVLAKKITVQTLAGLAVIFGLVIIVPFVGMLLMIPIMVLVWLRYSQAIWDTWEGLKSAKISAGNTSTGGGGGGGGSSWGGR